MKVRHRVVRNYDPARFDRFLVKSNNNEQLRQFYLNNQATLIAGLLRGPLSHLEAPEAITKLFPAEISGQLPPG